MRIPVATYRLQFNQNFGFKAAQGIVTYLSDLGFSDIYASPIFWAKPGSLHGYDVVDPTRLNPELGSLQDFETLIQKLQQDGMGWLQDVVPNHMCITSSENLWWMDILENGPSSPYAHFFDIDWNPVKKELKNKVLLPFLGDQYGTVLDNGELRLVFQDGAFFIHYGDQRFPIRPQTYTQILEHWIGKLEKSLGREHPAFAEFLSIITALNHLPPYTERDAEKLKERYREKEIVKRRLWNLYQENREIKTFIDENVNLFNGRKGESESFNHLDKLLSEQVYRLSHWRVAGEEINYRRFFDINDLAAIRMEDPQVFQETHRLIFDLIREGKITGLRVDHPDGLYNPSEYFMRLQQGCVAQLITNPEEIVPARPSDKPFYIVGEKILIRGERMPEDWPIHSTTGYVFMNSLNGIFVRADHARAFDQLYSKFIKSKMNYPDTEYENKKLIMQIAMSSEVNTLGHYLDRLSEKSRHTRDFTLNSLTAATVEVIAFFPVYRTYINPSGVNDRDRKYVEVAVSKAKRKNPAISESIFEFLKRVLLLNHPAHLGEEGRREWLNFVMRFQQVTGPVMAKGVEDTVFYIYNRFISLNEVGGTPERFGTSLETFHGQNIERSKSWPHALIATSTHDSKRGEDVRARINVLSEIPEEWKDHLAKWHRTNQKMKPVTDGLAVPDPNEEHLLYQTLIGAWLIEPVDQAEYEAFKRKIMDYMTKTVREAKVNSSWVNPNRPYEDALMVFIERILDPHSDNLFLEDFRPFQKKISHYGMFNSLSQTLIKITAPGVPDFYQGTELWDFSLVDPDNRRPVDFEKRKRVLNEIQTQKKAGLLDLMIELLSAPADGRIKLFLTHRVLQTRRSHKEVFQHGAYIPIKTVGRWENHIVAFARRHREAWAMTLAPRFLTPLIKEGEPPMGLEVWEDTRILLPEDAPSAWEDAITGQQVSAQRSLPVGEVLKHFPVSLLMARE